jgi:DNA repair ATPase RecN
MRTRHLIGLLIVAILLVSTAPLYAQRQQGNVAKLKADAQKVVNIISGDEAKTQTYCEARDIAEQIVQAVQQKDNEKVEDLSNNLIEQQKNLGSEYLALMESLRSVILSPKDTQEIEARFDRLDESCPQPGPR